MASPLETFLLKKKRNKKEKLENEQPLGFIL